MIEVSNKSKCSGCHACYNICPSHSISMEMDAEGFLYPNINKDKCVNCGLCEKVCPFTKKIKKVNPIGAFASKCKDDNVRFESSSGGLFTILALQTIKSGGVVYGAAFSPDFREVRHISVHNSDGLKKLRTSKYVQSSIGESYKEVKKLLDDGVEVLFSGVPCQIAGLKFFLNKEYDNLFCIDVICHGVPSPKLWEMYVNYVEQKYQGIVTNVNCRHKKKGWKNFGISRSFDTVEVFTEKGSDPYLQMFLNNYSLRPSCYSCQSKSNGAVSDITLGDFWGVQNVCPQMDDGKGTSAVIIHTAKGERLFDKIKGEVLYESVSYGVIEKYNSPIYKSVEKPQERDAFYLDMSQIGFDALAQKYNHPPQIGFIRRVKKAIKRTKLWKYVFRSSGGYNQI